MLATRLKPKTLLATSLKILIACQIHQSSVKLSQAMRAVRQNGFGNAEKLFISNEEPIPALPAQNILIKVHTAALNRADLVMRQGKYPGQKSPENLGLEVSGLVERVGPDAGGWEVGDRVMALLPGGGYAEFASAHRDHAMKVPAHISLRDAAGIPEAWLTAYQLLHLVAKLEAEERVLVHGGGSGVGTAAVQLVRLANATSYVTAGSSKKIEFAKGLGAEGGFNYKEGEFAAKVKEATGGQGVDVVLDCVGGSYWAQNADCLAFDGRWVLFGLLGGPVVDGPLLGKVLGKRLALLGSTLKARSVEYKARLVREFTKNALPHFAESSGVVLKPIVDREFSMDEVVEAHRYMESNLSNGKILLRVAPDAKEEL